MSQHEDQYPYLVAWVNSRTERQHGPEDDVEMEESEIGAGTVQNIASRPSSPGAGSSEVSESGLQYLAIDTNVFLNELRLVRSLYSLLASHTRNVKARILVPNTVINELDNLSKSEIVAGVSPEGDVHLSDLARNATSWLLEVAKKSRKDSIVRCQKLSEKLDKDLRKGDDRILDCCLYFAVESKVSLWTNDQNLSLLAEANDISTVGGSDTSLSRILQTLNVLQTPSLQTTVRKLEEEARKAPILPPSDEIIPNGSMELDVDLILSKLPQVTGDGPTMHSLGLTSQAHTPTPRSHSSRSSSNSPSKNPSSPFFDPPPRPTSPLIPSGHTARRLSPALDTAFKIAFGTFASSTTLSSSWPSIDSDSATSTPVLPNVSAIRLTKDLMDRLSDLDKQVSIRLRPDNEDDQMDYRRLLKCISSTKDVFSFLTPARFARTPRTGEICNALRYLGDWVPVIVGMGSREDLYSLADHIERSPL